MVDITGATLRPYNLYLADLAASTSGVSMTAGLNAAGSAVVKVNPRWFDARDYGTLGTTAALVAAIAAAAVAGGIVYASAAAWAISAKVTIPSKVYIAGDGIDNTIFTAANGLNDHMFTTTDTETLWAGTTEDGAQYWGISGCTISGNKANQTQGCGIRTYSRTYSVKNVKIENCKNKGFQSRWGDGPAYDDPDARAFDVFMEADIDNLLIQYCNEEGFWFDGPHDSRISKVICGLNSHEDFGGYSGFYTGPLASGSQITDCHSWGEYQEYAFAIESPGVTFSNCYPDEAYVALVSFAAANIKWWGGNMIGGFINTPPSTSDKNRKGFVFTSSAFYPTIYANVVNCPKGMIDFTDVGNLGGVVNIFGHLDAAIQTAATGETTYGFQGSVPSTFLVSVYGAGFGNNAAAHQVPAPLSFVDGTAGFPSIRQRTDITTGFFFASNKVGASVAGTEKLGILATKLDIAVPIEFAPGASVTPTNNGDVVFELTSNTTITIKAKGTDGTVRSGTVTLS
jgi:hypothetical protein